MSAGCIHPPADACPALTDLADIVNTFEDSHPGAVLPVAQDFKLCSLNSRLLNYHWDVEVRRFWTAAAAILKLPSDLS